MLLEDIGGYIPNEQDELDLLAEAEFGEAEYVSDVDAKDQRVLAEEKRTGHHENFRDAMDRSLQMMNRGGKLGGQAGIVLGSNVPVPDMAGPVPGSELPPIMRDPMRPEMDPRLTV